MLTDTLEIGSKLVERAGCGGYRVDIGPGLAMELWPLADATTAAVSLVLLSHVGGGRQWARLNEQGAAWVCQPDQIRITTSTLQARVPDHQDSRLVHGLDLTLETDASAALPEVLARVYRVATTAREALAAHPELSATQLGPYPASLLLDGIGLILLDGQDADTAMQTLEQVRGPIAAVDGQGRPLRRALHAALLALRCNG